MYTYKPFISDLSSCTLLVNYDKLMPINLYTEWKKSAVVNVNEIELREALDCTWLYKTVHMSKVQFRQNVAESCYKLNYFPN